MKSELYSLAKMEINEENRENKGSSLRRDLITKRFKMLRICFAFTMQVSKR